MNKRQAKAYVLRCLSVEVRHHLANGSAWMEAPPSGEFTATDRVLVREAVEEVAYELARRAAR